MYFDDFSFNDFDNTFMGKIKDINPDGYIYGNMFKDEYVPYKDYKVYEFIVDNDEQKLRLKIMEDAFILNDLGLYLDVHPDDMDVYNLFKKHNESLDKNIRLYQDMYTSICLNSQKDNYNWIDNPWPWDGDNNV